LRRIKSGRKNMRLWGEENLPPTSSLESN